MKFKGILCIALSGVAMKRDFVLGVKYAGT